MVIKNQALCQESFPDMAMFSNPYFVHYILTTFVLWVCHLSQFVNATVHQSLEDFASSSVSTSSFDFVVIGGTSFPFQCRVTLIGC